ncbi:MAG: pseudouridine synthase, partial [bacterium]|nr:pseudouridine synthase [bacterium]
GDKITEKDSVEVKWRAKNCRYYAYNKPRGIITHSPQGDEEEDIAMILPSNLKNVFPVGRLDKDSFGLIILTDDGRIVDPLLNPDFVHEKEYWVTTTKNLPPDFKERIEKGVDIGGYVTKPCKIELLSYNEAPRSSASRYPKRNSSKPATLLRQGYEGFSTPSDSQQVAKSSAKENKFSITLTEGKKHQIRRMCGVFGLDASGIERKRIMNIKLGHLPAGEHRPIQGKELQDFLKALGF